MALVSDLMAYGRSWPEAGVLGNTPVSITAAGTIAGQAAATTIVPGTNIAIIATGSAAACATVMSTAWSLGTPVYVINNTGVTASVFCPVSGSMNGTSNGSLTLATAKSAIFIQTTAGVWASFPATNQ